MRSRWDAWAAVADTSMCVLCCLGVGWFSMADLLGRMEVPNGTKRWDEPLFTVREDDALPVEQITQVSTATPHSSTAQPSTSRNTAHPHTSPTHRLTHCSAVHSSFSLSVAVARQATGARACHPARPARRHLLPPNTRTHRQHHLTITRRPPTTTTHTPRRHSTHRRQHTTAAAGACSEVCRVEACTRAVCKDGTIEAYAR